MDVGYLDTRAAARKALDDARLAHLLALRRAIGAGVPEAEMDQDVAAFGSACVQILSLARSA